MKKWSPKIEEILSRYLQSEQGEMSKEIKELFRSDSIGML
jgi:hypothetical protein